MAEKNLLDAFAVRVSRRAVLRDISLLGIGLPVFQMVGDSEARAQSADAKAAGSMVSKPAFSLA